MRAPDTPEPTRKPLPITEAHYADVYVIEAPNFASRTAESWLREVLEGPPRLVRSALRLGWRLMSLQLAPYPSERGVLGWTILRSEATLVQVAVEGRLGLRANLILSRESPGLTLSTRVAHDRIGGRILWQFARPLHPPIVRALLSRIGRVTTSNTGIAGVGC